MILLVWFVIGTVTGWLEGKALRGKGFDTIGNIVMGVAGAMAGGWLAVPSLDAPYAVNSSSLASLAVALIGALTVTTAVHLLRRAAGVRSKAS